MQQSPTQGRVQSFSSLNRRGYTDLTNQVADLDLNLNHLKDSQNSYMESFSEYPSPYSYQHYVSPQARPGSASMWATRLSSSSKALSSYFPDTSTDGALAEQLNANKASMRNCGSASLGNGYRRQPSSPGYFHVNEAASTELQHAPLRLS
jgi:hypothetical protein